MFVLGRTGGNGGADQGKRRSLAVNVSLSLIGPRNVGAGFDGGGVTDAAIDSQLAAATAR